MPAGIAVDRSGNLFVADLGNKTGGGSAGLYEVLAVGGYTTVNSLAGGSFYAPAGVAVDGSGNIFVADKGDGAGGHHAGVYEVLAAGGYTTVNPLASGTFYAPAGIAVDGSGDVFVVDHGNGSGGNDAGVYEISGAIVTQLAPSAGFEAPVSIAVDRIGNIFVADYGDGLGGNHAGFYEISGATIMQLAASEGFQAPSGIAVDANDNIFATDEAEATVKELASGSYSTVISLGSGFSSPMGLALDWGDNVYVADSGIGRVEDLELLATNLGTVEVGSSSVAPVPVTFKFNAAVTLDPASPFKVLTQGVAGLDITVTSGSTGNCSGSYSAGNSCTVSVTFSPQFAGTRYGAVTLYGSSGLIATANLFGKGIAPQLAFAGGTQSLVASGINSPSAVEVDAGGNIFVPSKGAGTVDKITLSDGSYSAPVPIMSGLASPMGVALDGSGNIFVADYSLGINEAAQSQGSYSQSRINGLSGLVGIAVDQYENLYTTDASNGTVYKETLSNGGYIQTAMGTGFINPAGIVVDGYGNVFLNEYGRGTVDELTPFNGGYTEVTVDSGLSDPEGIAMDATGSLYISSANTSIIYKETPTSNGSYTRSAIFTNINPQPWWTTIDASGNLYFTANNSEPSDGVYKIDAVDAPFLSFPTPTALGLPDSTDNSQIATLWNIGNASLTFPVPAANNSNPSFSAGSAYTLDSLSTCPNLSSSSTQGTEAPGGSCTYAVDFTPNTLGINSGLLALTDSNLNAHYASQSISLSGIAATAAATPTFSPAAGTYTSIQSVTIADKTAGAKIYYTTNGTAPTTGGTLYSGPVTVGSSETLEAIAVASSFSQSATGSAAYTINLPAAATPTFSPRAGTYTSIQSVTIADKTAGATIYYTTNGTTPTTGSTPYTTPISVSATETIKAIAVAAGYSQSAAGSAAYTINLPAAATPTFSPAAGTYTSIQSVTIADKTAGATIYYTTNGTTPTTGSTPYTTPISVSATETIKAIAVATGYSQSATASAAYTINLTTATPTFTPAAGTYTSIQSVTIADATTGAAIYYTTNGTTPTTSSTPYTSAISVSATETIKAIAVATGYSQSATGSAAYTINLPAAATPTFMPVAGRYTSIQSVTIGDTTTGAAIYYTTNGTTPTTSSTPYTSAISVSATETIKAIALATGYRQSATASAAYTITLPAAATPTFSPKAGTYTSIQSVTIGDTTTGAAIYYTTNGTTPTTSSTPYTSAISVSATETIKAIAVATGYSQSATGSATYTINLTAATPTFTPPAGTYTSTQSVAIADTTPGAAIYYTTNGTTPTTSSTPYTSAISVSATETIKAIAVATGYSQSPTGSAAYTINLPAATPTFTPPAGTYTSTQSVIIADTTTGAAIYYTTNGTTPTTSSTPYTSAISVSATETINAIAVASGYSQSALASAVYTIAPRQTPSVSAWPAASAITYGQTLASSTLTGGTASVSGTFAWTSPTTAPSAGMQSESVTFTSMDTTDYNTVTGSITVSVNSATPSVSAWPTASAITFGQMLSSSTLTGGSATPSAGSFKWTSPSAVPLAGTQPESVVYVPTDTVDYSSSAPGTVSVSVNPASFIVTVNSDDSGTASNCTPQTTPGHGTDTSCSLRDALLEAAATGGGDISFDATAFGTATTITLINGTLTIPSATTITGTTTGSGTSQADLVTVDGNAAATVFTVGSGVTGASIANLIIQNGNGAAAGGIQNAGALTLIADSVSSNTASGAGGGINTSGSLTLSASTISGNTAGGAGGGISNSGSLTLADDTLTGNSTSGTGGGIYNTATLVVSDSTLSGNTAATAAGGGGIDNTGSGTVALANAILSGNSANSIPDDFDGVAYTDNGGNVIGAANSVTVNGNSISLAPLGSYGGPTPTLIPLPGSPAICAGLVSGIPSGLTTDQRGLPNTNASYPGYTTCADAGAVQTNYTMSFATQPTDAPVDTNFAAAVTLTESGAPFQPAVTIPLTLTGTGTLSGGSAATSSGVANYALQVNTAGSKDTLTANLTLNGALNPAVAITATSNTFSVGFTTPTVNLSLSSPSITYGTQETLTATVPSGDTGSVTFYTNGTTVLGMGTVSEGTASFSSATLTAGSYSITAAYSGDSNNNPNTSTAQSLTVSQATPSISGWPAASAITYGQMLVSSTLAGGTASVGGTFEWTSPTTVPGAGTQFESVNFKPADATDFTTVTQTVQLTVSQAVLTVTATNASVPYNQAIPQLTYGIAGYVNGDTSSVLSGAPAETTTAVKGSPVGTYPITITQGTLAASNYGFQFQNGTLTITSLGTAITPTFSPAAGPVSNPTTVTASSTSACSSYMYFDTNNPPGTQQTTYSVTTAVTLYAQVRGCPGYADSAVASAAYTISAIIGPFNLIVFDYGTCTSGSAPTTACLGSSTYPSLPSGASYTVTNTNSDLTVTNSVNYSWPTFTLTGGSWPNSSSSSFQTALGGATGDAVTINFPSSTVQNTVSSCVPVYTTWPQNAESIPGQIDAWYLYATDSFETWQLADESGTSLLIGNECGGSPTGGTCYPTDNSSNGVMPTGSWEIACHDLTLGANGSAYQGMWATPQNGGALLNNSLTSATGTPTAGGTNLSSTAGLGTHTGPSGYNVNYGAQILCGLTAAQSSCGFPIAPGLQLIAPTLTPPAGAYNSSSPQTVTIGNVSPQSDTLYYTTCSTVGCTPATPTTASNTVTNGGTISVTIPETVSAIAVRTGNPSSPVTTAAYTEAIASAPTFSPNGGSAINPTTVTASTTTSGCGSYIYFGAGNPPTVNETTYSVTTAITLYAYVHGCPGYSDSSVSSATFTIGTPTTVTYAGQYCTGGGGNTCAMTPGSDAPGGDAIVAAIYSGGSNLAFGTVCDGTGGPNYCTGGSSYNIEPVVLNGSVFASNLAYTCDSAAKSNWTQLTPSTGAIGYSSGIVATGNTTTGTACNDGYATPNVVTSATTSYTTNSVTTTNAHDLLVAVFVNDAGGTCTAGTDGQGHTMTVQAASYGVVCVETYNETTKATYTATMTGPRAPYMGYLIAIK
jgi:hypothetical protein